VQSRLAGVISGIILSSALVPASVLAQQAAPSGNQPAPPALNDLLLRLQTNLWDYLSTVPDFFADEHVVSEVKQEGARGIKTTTDSVFRLVRSHAVGEAHIFTESREVKLVNKKPAKGEDLRGPAIFGGAFSSGITVVSLEMSRCFDYTLQPQGELDKAPALIVDYAFIPDMLNDDGCPGPEKESGRAYIDPVNFRLLRVEATIPRHKDNNGLTVLWRWSIDYAPVTFDNKQFWMPKTITSRADAFDASAIWNFTATYTNYHKLSVSSHIVTDTNANPPPK
jgi:hypothetical protein